jgi:hypothetical protein
MPVFDGYEFDGYRTLKPVEDKNVRVFFDCPEDKDFVKYTRHFCRFFKPMPVLSKPNESFN